MGKTLFIEEISDIQTRLNEFYIDDEAIREKSYKIEDAALCSTKCLFSEIPTEIGKLKTFEIKGAWSNPANLLKLMDNLLAKTEGEEFDGFVYFYTPYTLQLPAIGRNCTYQRIFHPHSGIPMTLYIYGDCKDGKMIYEAALQIQYGIIK